MKKFILYLMRWQMSSLILIPVIAAIADPVWSAIIGNLIGGCIFFFIDKRIFNGDLNLWRHKK